jgi:hypothetical protein
MGGETFALFRVQSHHGSLTAGMEILGVLAAQTIIAIIYGSKEKPTEEDQSKYINHVHAAEIF